MFYSIDDLRYLGVNLKSEINIFISKNVTIYNPSNLTIHNDIRIDDFTVLTCKGKIEVKSFVRISTHCLISSETSIIIEECCNICSGVKIYGGINLNDENISNPLIHKKYSTTSIGDVIINKYVFIGANSIVYPNVILSEGVTIEPLSKVNINTESWKLYGGNPINFIKNKKINYNVIKNINNELFFNDLYIQEIETNNKCIEDKKSVSFSDKQDVIINTDTDTDIKNNNNDKINDNSYKNELIIKNNKKLNILITGGSKGIGKNIATNFFNKGHNVIITYNNSQKEANDLSQLGVFVYKLDITNNLECQNVLTTIIEKFDKIDVLINNAGILKNNLFHNMTHDDWYEVINTNLISIYNITNPVIKNMLEFKKGKIINISSVYGIKGSKGQTNYCASKFGIVGFTKALALEYGNKNIYTNCICPGLVDTDMINSIDNKVLDKIVNSIPTNKLIKPNEIFNICELLVNSESCNGTIFNIDGGMSS